MNLGASVTAFSQKPKKAKKAKKVSEVKEVKERKTARRADASVEATSQGRRENPQTWADLRSNMHTQLIDSANNDLKALGQETFMQDLGVRYRDWSRENATLNAESERLIREFERVEKTHEGPTATFDALCESVRAAGTVPDVLVDTLQRNLKEMALKRDMADIPLMTRAWFGAGARGGLYGWLSQHNLGVRGRRDLTSCMMVALGDETQTPPSAWPELAHQYAGENAFDLVSLPLRPRHDQKSPLRLACYDAEQLRAYLATHPADISGRVRNPARAVVDQFELNHRHGVEVGEYLSRADLRRIREWLTARQLLLACLSGDEQCTLPGLRPSDRADLRERTHKLVARLMDRFDEGAGGGTSLTETATRRTVHIFRKLKGVLRWLAQHAMAIVVARGLLCMGLNWVLMMQNLAYEKEAPKADAPSMSSAKRKLSEGQPAQAARLVADAVSDGLAAIETGRKENDKLEASIDPMTRKRRVSLHVWANTRLLFGRFLVELVRKFDMEVGLDDGLLMYLSDKVWRGTNYFASFVAPDSFTLTSDVLRRVSNVVKRNIPATGMMTLAWIAANTATMPGAPGLLGAVIPGVGPMLAAGSTLGAFAPMLGTATRFTFYTELATRFHDLIGRLPLLGKPFARVFGDPISGPALDVSTTAGPHKTRDAHSRAVVDRLFANDDRMSLSAVLELLALEDGLCALLRIGGLGGMTSISASRAKGGRTLASCRNFTRNNPLGLVYRALMASNAVQDAYVSLAFAMFRKHGEDLPRSSCLRFDEGTLNEEEDTGILDGLSKLWYGSRNMGAGRAEKEADVRRAQKDVDMRYAKREEDMRRAHERIDNNIASAHKILAESKKSHDDMIKMLKTSAESPMTMLKRSIQENSDKIHGKHKKNPKRQSTVQR